MEEMIDLAHQLSDIIDKNVMGNESTELAEELLSSLLDEIEELK